MQCSSLNFLPPPDIVVQYDFINRRSGSNADEMAVRWPMTGFQGAVFTACLRAAVMS